MTSFPHVQVYVRLYLSVKSCINKKNSEILAPISADTHWFNPFMRRLWKLQRILLTRKESRKEMIHAFMVFHSNIFKIHSIQNLNRRCFQNRFVILSSQFIPQSATSPLSDLSVCVIKQKKKKKNLYKMPPLKKKSLQKLLKFMIRNNVFCYSREYIAHILFYPTPKLRQSETTKNQIK